MEKQSKTYNGAMSNLSESIQVLKGEFAKGLFKAVKKLIPQLTKMFDWLGENYKIIVAIAAPLLTFLNVVTGFLIIKKVTAGFAAFNAVLAANPIMAIVAAVAALVVGIVYLWNNCEAFRNFWINLWNIIKQVCINIINGIISFFQSIPQTVNNIVNAIIGFINNLPEYLEFVLGFMVGLIVKFFLRLWEFITNDIPNIFAAIVSWLVKFVTQDIPNFINNVIKAIASLPGKIWNVLVDMYNKAKAGITNVFNVIVDTMKKLPGQMLDIGRNIVKGIWDGINGAKDWIGKKIGGFANGIVKGFKKALGIHSPSVIMEKQIGINVGLGVVEGIDDTQKQINETIGGISASMTAGIGSNFSAMGTMQSSNIRPIINVYNNMELDPLGQVVSNVKTFSGGAKNDYNYGVGV
jgi:phage-related protein